MSTISTNIRFDKHEYQELKKLALAEKSSIAHLVREATSEYRSKKIKSSSRNKLFNQIIKSSIKIDTPVNELIHSA